MGESIRRERRNRSPFSRVFNRFFDRFLAFAAALAGVMLVVLSAAIAWSVISRKWLGEPLAWTVEVSEYALLAITFLGAAWVLRRDGHVKIDLLVNVLPPRIRLGVHGITQLVGLAVSALLAYYTYVAIAKIYSEGQLLRGVLTVPKWIVMAVIPVGFVLLSVQFAQNLFALKNEMAAIEDRASDTEES